MRPDHLIGDYAGRRVTVFGLGSFGGGVGAVRFLAARGAILTVTDRRAPEQLQESLEQLRDVAVTCWRLGEHVEADFTTADLVVVNPAIRRDHPLLQACHARGIPLTSEMNLFWQHNPAPVIAVSGSNGKSTTTALLHAMLQAGPRRCWLGGNLGRSLLPNVDAISTNDLVVLELSSFQLADLNRLQVSPHGAIITNFSPNHLDWHPTLDDYRSAKQTLLRWQTAADFAVLNACDDDVSTWATQGRRFVFTDTTSAQDGASLEEDVCLWRDARQELRFPLTEWLSLPGRHNVQNALAAAAAALALGTSLSAMETGVRHYVPLPHRLQFVGEVAGRRFYNDSLATTPESTLVALAAFSEPIVLLAGGYDKQVDLTAMATAIATHTKAVALLGQTAGTLQCLISETPRCRTQISANHADFRSAFQAAVAISSPCDVVLLSPGCASYDWFRNFEDRGRQFTELVQQWAALHGSLSESSRLAASAEPTAQDRVAKADPG